MERVMENDDRNPAKKLFLAGVVAAILAVPLFMVYLLVYDREQQSDTARSSIAQGWGGPQRLAGPLLVLPYQATKTETVKEGDKDVVHTSTEWKSLYLAPLTLKLDTRLEPERRSRSIYEAVLYSTQAKGHAVYQLPGDFARLGIAPEAIAFDRAELRFGISDPRGLKPDTRVTVNGAALPAQPGNGTGATNGAGFFVGFDATPLRTGPIAADFQFGFRGHTAVALDPHAGQTEWTVSSSWPSPSFTGNFLPESPKVAASGFSATYRISNLALGTTLLSTEDDRPAPTPGDAATTNPYGESRMLSSPPEPLTGARDVRVGLIQPVDLYSQINRSVKYGFLFIGFTFIAFLMFDVVGGRRVSAIEYLLVGAGLVLFFVMLLAFAEVTGFFVAYLIAAAAITGLLTAYSAAVLASWRRAGAIAALLAALYTVLYVLLSLEDYSLLIGSLLLFAALAAVMYLTRNLEWGGRQIAPDSQEDGKQDG
jgi:inner membrane protein